MLPKCLFMPAVAPPEPLLLLLLLCSWPLREREVDKHCCAYMSRWYCSALQNFLKYMSSYVLAARRVSRSMYSLRRSLRGMGKGRVG